MKKNGFDTIKRGTICKYITEITKDNVQYCIEITKILGQKSLRHLDAIKGNFVVTETEFVSPSYLQEAQPLQQVVYSNVREVVDQHKRLFETLWNTGAPSEQKIKEIEEGISPTESKILYGPESTTTAIVSFLSNALSQMNICADNTWPSVSMGIDAEFNVCIKR